MIIALLTDFGSKDYFVGAMKGAIFSINSHVGIVDITHEISPQDISAASFTLRACFKDFPTETIFVAVVDPGVGSNRRAILVETKNYRFLAPDNGLLSLVFDEERNFRVFELTNEKFFASNVSRTFHGRDVFAPVAAHLSKGIVIEEFGREIYDFVRFGLIKPERISDSEIQAEIIHVDNFGNLVTNLKEEDLPENFTAKINGTAVEKLLEYYAAAEKDEVFMILGSTGFLEIAAFKDSAARVLGVGTGEKFLLKVKN